ncbi:MAG: 4-hydroxyphenylacetate 3-hydroxylase family protein, partial [Gaiellaceae bacterium]
MARSAEEQTGSDTTARPMNGEEYLESLRDGREIWIYGDKVDDVTTHPAFRNGVRSVARLYDALHDPETKDVLTVETDTGSGGYTHPYFKAPRSAEDLVRGRDAIAAWQRLTYGWMGRSPDYKAAFLATYGPNADYYKPFEANARRWYKESQERVYFMNHTLVNPPVDRNKEIHEVDDVFIHAVKETDEGVVVRGAKMVATGSAYSNYNFVSYHGSMPIKKEEYALSFFAPMNIPGVKLLCRPSYEFMAATIGSPFDYPLSSRFDENDAVLMFDDVLIPWENFLIYGNLEIASTYHLTGFIWRALLQGCTRLAVKLDFLAGLFIKAVEATGTVEFRGVQASIGEILAWRNAFWALTDAMCHNPVPAAEGTVLPNIEAASAYRILSNQAYPAIKTIIENQTGGALIVRPSSARDWKEPELRPLLDQFYRGSNGYDAEHKIKLVNLLWDAIGSEFGGRHELYE